MLMLSSVCTLATAAAADVALKLTVEDSGHFVIDVGSHGSWLAGSEYQVNGLSSSAGTLAVSGPPAKSSGTDQLGAYHATTLAWAKVGGSDDVIMRTAFRTYPEDAGLITFEQSFPKDIHLTPTPLAALRHADGPVSATAAQSASTVFPSFNRNPGPADGLNTFSYSGVFPQMRTASFSKYAETHQGGVPLCVYNASDPALPMVVLSPLDSPKAQHMATSPSWVGAGTSAGKQWTSGFGVGCLGELYLQLG